MKVLLVSDSYPPLVGGATRATHLLATELTERGYEVCVATIVQDEAPQHERLDGIEVHRLQGLTLRVPGASADPYRNTPPPFPDPETAWRLRRLIRDLGPDLVHSYGWITLSCALAMRRTKTPLLVSARDYGNVCAKRTLVYEGGVCSGPAPLKCAGCASAHYGAPKGLLATAGVLLGRRLIRRRAQAVHGVSGYVQDVMRRDLLAPGDSPVEAVIPDFREPATAESPEHPRLPDEPFILFVGALRRIKGVEELLAAYAELDTEVPLVLVGGRAPDTPASFPEGVVVLEQLPYQEVLGAWTRALFGVAPSVLAEPFGNVIHEAMSMGCPVIGTFPGGHGDMIEPERTGLLVPGGDADALRRAMERLLADAPLRERMAEQAREKAEEFTAEAIVPRFEELYARTVRAGGPTGAPAPAPARPRG